MGEYIVFHRLAHIIHRTTPWLSTDYQQEKEILWIIIKTDGLSRILGNIISNSMSLRLI